MNCLKTTQQKIFRILDKIGKHLLKCKMRNRLEAETKREARSQNVKLRVKPVQLGGTVPSYQEAYMLAVVWKGREPRLGEVGCGIRNSRLVPLKAWNDGQSKIHLKAESENKDKGLGLPGLLTGPSHFTQMSVQMSPALSFMPSLPSLLHLSLSVILFFVKTDLFSPRTKTLHMEHSGLI